jgi:hypothetical protein
MEGPGALPVGMPDIDHMPSPIGKFFRFPFHVSSGMSFKKFRRLVHYVKEKLACTPPVGCPGLQ